MEKFELNDGDFYAVSLAIDTARRFLQEPQITPLQIIGLGNALYALERLPLATPGAYSKFGVEFHTGAGEKQFISFTVAEDYFEITRSGHENDDSTDGSSFSEPGWMFDIDGCRTEACDLYDLEEGIESYLDLGARIAVTDQSSIEYEEDTADTYGEQDKIDFEYEQDEHYSRPEIKGVPAEAGPVNVVVSRQDVERKNIAPAITVLSKLTASPQVARASMERVAIDFAGYEQEDRELYEIPEVRDYVHLLDEHFPYWLFFLSKYFYCLQTIMSCFLLPHLAGTAKIMRHPKQLQELLNKRWLPAMNQIGRYAGLSEDEIEDLTDRSLAYFSEGTLEEPW